MVSHKHLNVQTFSAVISIRMQLVPLLELQNLCTLNADLLKMLSSKMLASKTKECEILRNELKELNDSVKSFSSPPANSWEVQSLQSPGTQGQNMRPNRFSHIII